MERLRAALIHLLPSILILAIIATLVMLAWYPYPFLQFRESDKFSLILIISAALIGPALTWLVNTKGKRRKLLLLDLLVIVFVQLAAVGWGVNALYQNRPYFMVFTLDRFDVLPKREVDVSGITNSKFLEKPFNGPVLLYASMPKNAKDFQKLLQEVMFEGKPDIQYRPEFWSLYREKQGLVLEVSKPLAELRNARPESTSAIDKLVKINGDDITALEYVPAKLPNGQFAVILDGASGEIVDTLVVDPWVN